MILQDRKRKIPSLPITVLCISLVLVLALVSLEARAETIVPEPPVEPTVEERAAMYEIEKLESGQKASMAFPVIPQARERQRDVDAPTLQAPPAELDAVHRKCRLNVDVHDPSGIGVVMLYLRYEGETEFRPLAMERTAANRWSETVEPTDRTTTIYYYFEASDSVGNGPARSGSATRPYVVDVDFAPSIPRGSSHSGNPAPWIVVTLGIVGLIVFVRTRNFEEGPFRTEKRVPAPEICISTVIETKLQELERSGSGGGKAPEMPLPLQPPRPEQPLSARSDQRGFSLIELMFVLAILALTAGIATTHMTRFVEPVEMAGDILEGTLRQARSRAMATTTAHRVSMAGNTFVVESASNDSCAAPTWTAEPALTMDVTDGVTIIPTNWQVCFDSRGTASQSVAVSVDHQEYSPRSLQVMLGGTIRWLE